MTINADEYKSVVGLDKLYYALVSADSAAAYSVGSIKPLAPAAEASQEPNVSSETQYADNKPYDVAEAEGETKITLTLTNLPLVTYAEITGQVYDEVNGLVYDDGGVAPYCALWFRSMKSNGKYRYFEFLKGKFAKPKEGAKSKTEKVEFQPQTLEFTAIFTTHEFSTAENRTRSLKRIVGDEDVDNFDGSDWFSALTVPPETPGESI